PASSPYRRTAPPGRRPRCASGGPPPPRPGAGRRPAPTGPRSGGGVPRGYLRPAGRRPKPFRRRILDTGGAPRSGERGYGAAPRSGERGYGAVAAFARTRGSASATILQRTGLVHVLGAQQPLDLLQPPADVDHVGQLDDLRRGAADPQDDV